ncbi:MAG: hypothetical protein HGB12_08180 [Bacteroidetes bacterium]|nr:hypothetical protein [Bacteroidota bacterium]
MKKNMKISAIVIIQILFLSLYGFSQTQTLSGKQTQGVANKNGELICVPLVLAQAATITAVSGNNDGFWIEKEGYAKPIYNYYTPNDPKVITVILKPGKYWIYPNIKKEMKEATVVLTLTNL